MVQGFCRRGYCRVGLREWVQNPRLKWDARGKELAKCREDMQSMFVKPWRRKIVTVVKLHDGVKEIRR